jgi:hypothetical protein
VIPPAAHGLPVSFALIGKLFGDDQGAIRKHAKKYSAGLNRIESPRHRSALPQDEIDQTVATILRFFEERTSLTLAESPAAPS